MGTIVLTYKVMGVKKALFGFLERHRGILVLTIVLPLSLLFDFWLSAKANARKLLEYLLLKKKEHHEKVQDIQAQVRDWNDAAETDRKFMCNARPNWQSLSTSFVNKDALHKIRVDLDQILSVNEADMTVHVEPGVTVGQITQYLIPKGYTLAVTLEISDATLGGLAMGVGMTTHSHKVGLYQETIVSYEMVLGDGSAVEATRDNEYSDLYYCLPWSHGTLGFLTALKLQIIPVKPYIHMTYIPVHGLKNFSEKMRQYSGALDKDAKLPDYVEATLYSKDEAVIMVGRFADVDEARSKVNNVSAWYAPWFYKHVQTIMQAGKQVEEYIPLRQYLLRHNRAIFWVVEDMLPFGNNTLFRYIFGWLLPPKPAFLKFTTTPGYRVMTFAKSVFQDIVLPMTELESSILQSEKLFDVWPLLVYPCRIYNRGQGQLRHPKPNQMCPGADYGMFYDLGIYGVPGPVKRKQRYDMATAMRSMENFTANVGGYPFLYADVFMTREEFGTMFNLEAYEACRKRYHAEGAFPNLYDKIKPEVDVVALCNEYMDPF